MKKIRSHIFLLSFAYMQCASSVTVKEYLEKPDQKIDGFLVNTGQIIKKITTKKYTEPNKECNQEIHELIYLPVGKRYTVQYNSGWFYNSNIELVLHPSDGTLKSFNFSITENASKIMESMAEIIKSAKTIGMVDASDPKKDNPKSFLGNKETETDSSKLQGKINCSDLTPESNSVELIEIEVKK